MSSECSEAIHGVLSLCPNKPSFFNYNVERHLKWQKVSITITLAITVIVVSFKGKDCSPSKINNN